MRRTLLAFCLAPLAVLVWAGCQPKVKLAADIDPTGTYALVSVDGSPLPATVTTIAEELTVKEGTLVIDADGTCASRTVSSRPSGKDIVQEEKCAYTRQGSTFTMRWEGDGTTTATVDGRTFTVHSEGMVFVFRR